MSRRRKEFEDLRKMYENDKNTDSQIKEHSFNAELFTKEKIQSDKRIAELEKEVKHLKSIVKELYGDVVGLCEFADIVKIALLTKTGKKKNGKKT